MSKSIAKWNLLFNHLDLFMIFGHNLRSNGDIDLNLKGDYRLLNYLHV